MKARYYLYVDETGQLQGRFVVAVALFEATDEQAIAEMLQSAETNSRKLARKWVRTPISSKRDYLTEIASICRRTSLQAFYAFFDDSDDYALKLTATLAATILAFSAEPDSRFTIVVDGLNAVERERVSRFLRRHTLPFRRDVRGGRDDHNPFLRLADAIAGFIRHRDLDEPYTVSLWEQLGPHVTQLRA